MLPIIAAQMRRHDAIVLEEPPSPDFKRMLRGGMSVDDYLLALDLEYPEFSRRMCRSLRELSRNGKQIIQVEPFLEVLLKIHEFFSQGRKPAEIEKNTLDHLVYLAERNATRALIRYYQTVTTQSFDNTIAAIKAFARMDAARFRLRDRLRARALAAIVEKYCSAYIEAGVIHFPLWRMLRRELSSQAQVRPMFLADVALKTMGKKGHLYGPGDQLTLLYIFHPDMAATRREQVLAARSIVYSKIIEKEELTDDLDTFPHLRDELSCIRTTRKLSLDDCRRLFPLVRRAKSSDARHIVSEYATKPAPRTRP